MSSALLALLLAPAGAAAARATMTDLPSFLMILGDDIGWADFSWNNGTANTPHMAAWAKRAGSILMQDSHSGGTVCSPTRASVLTGRTPLRDCINGVYGCSDMTECVPHFEFAPQRTFTIGDAARAASPEYVSQHWAKWHLGSLYNDSEAYGGLTSSPITHGFDHFNSTVEVAPTGTTNCQCNEKWADQCLFGHNTALTHCGGGPGPDPEAGKGCCFNYWWDNASSPHGVSNLSNPVPPDDTDYVSDSFDRFLDGLNGRPFVAQLAFHNCHIPYVGTPQQRQLCQEGVTCTESASSGPLSNLTSAQLDFYACLNELDGAVGRVLSSLDAYGYGNNTLSWLATDNGPEKDCEPEGYCTQDHYRTGPGSAVPLRGRKRDIWEGGHRIPSIVSWPAVVKGDAGRVSWEMITTHDFHATIVDVLKVKPPAHQAEWGMDGRSILPLLEAPPAPAQNQRVYADGANVMPIHGMGWMFNGWDTTDNQTHRGFRYGNWKFVHNTKSCSNSDCFKPQLFDLATDLSESVDVSAKFPAVFAAIQANFSNWYGSVLNSIVNESKCAAIGPHSTPAPAPPAPPSTKCSFRTKMALSGGHAIFVNASSQQQCCGACLSDPEKCGAAVYHGGGGKPTTHDYHQCVMRPPGTFTLKGVDTATSVVCVPTAAAGSGASAGVSVADREWVEAGN
jgi:arylsulfatase A-like enzyme